MLLLFRFNLDGKIRTPEFTELTADAVLGSRNNDLILSVHLQDIFRAKVHAYPASFTPLAIDKVAFELRFRHSIILSHMRWIPASEATLPEIVFI